MWARGGGGGGNIGIRVWGKICLGIRRLLLCGGLARRVFSYFTIRGSVLLGSVF